MQLRRPAAILSATLAVTSMTVLTGLAQADAVTPEHTTSAPVARVVEVHDWDVSGTVVGPNSEPVDNISVAAYKIGAKQPTASSITYGGEYDLYLPTGLYRIVAEDLGHTLAPAVVSANLVVSGDKTLPDVHMYFPAPVPDRLPAITGTAKVGGTLVATSGKWPITGLEFTYRWTSGHDVLGTGRTYKVKPADAGHIVQAEITATAPGVTATVAVTAQVRVAKTESTVHVKPITVHAHRVQIPVSVSASGSLRGEVVVREAGSNRAVGRAEVHGNGHWNGVVTLTGVREGQHRYTVTFTGNQSVDADVAPVERVRVH